MLNKAKLSSLALAGAGALALGTVLANDPAAAEEAAVINLTQVACQFVESENGVDHGFTTARKADCDAINAKTAAGRLAEAKVIELKPGKYIFRVTNQDVPYQLGFWLRGAGFGLLTLPSVSGGGLTLGATKDYAIDLEPGEYLYSCPLNPTPDYRIVVKG